MSHDRAPQAEETPGPRSLAKAFFLGTAEGLWIRTIGSRCP